MNFRTRLAAILTTLAVMTGVVVAQATPAQASWSQCPNYAVCIFEGSSGGSPLYWWTEEAWDDGCITFGSNWNDRAGSVYNRTPAWISSVRFFEHAGCAGDGNPGTLYTYNGQMKTFGTGSGLTQFNNVLSSLIVVGT